MLPKKILALAAALMVSASWVHAADLRIGLAEDPDVLDPDQSRTFVGRIVYASLCDKLVDITPALEITPMLATGWSWSDDGLTLTMTLREGVTFHDGTPFNAEAVAYNINRSKTLEESRRKSEVASIESTTVVDDYTIQMNLSKPDATLIAQLADRAGMMVSPTAAAATGAEFGLAPVCSGPFAFKERVQQDRIVLEKFPAYWNADAINFDSVTFLPIVDGTVRLANLRAGDIDILERLSATDVASAAFILTGAMDTLTQKPSSPAALVVPAALQPSRSSKISTKGALLSLHSRPIICASIHCFPITIALFKCTIVSPGRIILLSILYVSFSAISIKQLRLSEFILPAIYTRFGEIDQLFSSHYAT